MILFNLKNNADTSPDLKALSELFKNDKPSEDLPALLGNLKASIQNTQTSKRPRKPKDIV
jgi:hypothetical protein